MTSVDDLAAFKHIERPKDWNVPALRALFELVGIPPGQVNDLTKGKEEPSRLLEKKAEALAGRLAEGQQKLLQGLQLWGKPLLSEEEAKAYAQRMAGVKTFLESIQRYNSPAKLKNFKASATDIAAHEAGLQALRTVERLAKLAQGLGPLAQYLAQAETVLPEKHDWTTEVKALRSEVMAELDRPEAREDAGLEARLRSKLDAAKAQYIKAYTKLLREARLDLTQDQRKADDPPRRPRARLRGAPRDPDPSGRPARPDQAGARRPQGDEHAWSRRPQAPARVRGIPAGAGARGRHGRRAARHPRRPSGPLLDGGRRRCWKPSRSRRRRSG